MSDSDNRDSKGRFTKGNKIGKRFKEGNTESRLGGQPRRLANVLRELPHDAQEQVCQILWTAISMRNVKEGQKFIEDQAAELPELGMTLQICVRALLGKNGFQAVMDICDRLFGKPRQSHDVDMDANVQGVTVNVTSEEAAKALQDIMDKD